MTIYLTCADGSLTGPVELPVIPGLGVQMPSNALSVAEPLPEPQPGHVWVAGDAEPYQTPDFRGVVYRTNSGRAEHYDQLGPLPEGYTASAQPSADHRWQDGAWVIDLTALHTRRVLEINQACEASIIKGFCSSALGSPFNYDSQLEDQLNLNGVILWGADTAYACRDEEGKKIFRLHTGAQIREVGGDFTAFKLQLLQRANDLKQRLDEALDANDVSAFEAIQWEPEQ
ncbi:hypothetical protein BVY11_22445 [Pseudomonas amygdali pv. morsprunorum]|nr:hypothetical protein BVY11_22445 [Pseudomonas amygdali pv. morsprunorum]PPS36615.1 hypothetical protein BVY12_10650 [Pseudomonas amygdali pv. morsprunorum]